MQYFILRFLVSLTFVAKLTYFIFKLYSINVSMGPQRYFCTNLTFIYLYLGLYPHFQQAGFAPVALAPFISASRLLLEQQWRGYEPNINITIAVYYMPIKLFDFRNKITFNLAFPVTFEAVRLHDSRFLLMGLWTNSTRWNRPVSHNDTGLPAFKLPPPLSPSCSRASHCIRLNELGVIAIAPCTTAVYL